ncbi:MULTISPECIES: S-layer homology domain-containing protein [Peptoniphilus]|uniref:S-layer homology domain-containing protein n=1 Tax=Peptoniphilus TaxID=162289 RepID=UPI0029051F12|nr:MULTISPECIES: S-layer homology domain-containing protein [Peptoniphilus]MDU1043576.1 S-layer homology domain-containing protein [Peptoniphilus rhinitidis]MDU1954595.1 S-layer homology domain-containing protein [Peptoniphilus lacydonensis]MDU2110226.1 S-layer homology domain-containing protein [Peptoniphilus lacydonensis]MDU3750336.1 S-layer homology domain-containing protein [Peptoniphilus rhinitidis]MDU5274909.1 S-layer homology domain-containing protein [Peptoniphilus lacydonensis]
MKPYSKKYLALALAGVLVTSMPASIFASSGDLLKEAQNEEYYNSKKDKDDDDEKTTEADRNRSRVRDTRKTLEKGKRYDIEDIIDLPSGARVVEGETSFKYNETGKQTEYVTVKFKDGSKKEITLTFDVEKKSGRYDDVDISNVKYNGGEITGKTEPYADIYIERSRKDDRHIGEADRNGRFSIKYDISKDEIVYVYAEKDGDKSKRVKIAGEEDDYIKGSEVEANGLSIMGKTLTGFIRNHPYENIKVYYDGELYGTFRTDKNSYFSVKLRDDISKSDFDDLKFYKDKKTAENDKLTITEAKEGQKLVKGKANAKDTITVYDASNRKLGSIEVNNSGVFTVFLDRELIAGETIKVEAKTDDDDVEKLDYKVTKKAIQDERVISYIEGYPDETFKPQNNVTRAEAAQMFATLINGGSGFGFGDKTKFSDANDEWYSAAVNYVVEKKLISGYPNGTFKPNESITRAEFAQMISGYIKTEKTNKSDFNDVKDHWAKDAIDKLNGNKNVSGYPDGTFKPNEKITRAEAVTILNSVFDRNTNKDSLKDINVSSLTKFSDVKEDFWAYYNILDASNAHNRERANSNSEVDVWVEK